MKLPQKQPITPVIKFWSASSDGTRTSTFYLILRIVQKPKAPLGVMGRLCMCTSLLNNANYFRTKNFLVCTNKSTCQVTHADC